MRRRRIPLIWIGFARLGPGLIKKIEKCCDDGLADARRQSAAKFGLAGPGSGPSMDSNQDDRRRSRRQ